MRVAILTLAVAFFAGSSPSFADDPPAAPANGHHHSERVARQQGKASFYNDSFQGKKTANGEEFSQEKMTAASKDLPLGSHVTVTNKANDKSVDVKVNDRGPYVKGRVIDLSKKAAIKIGITTKKGLAPVKVEARPSSQPTEELQEAVREQAVGSGGAQEGGVQEAEGSSMLR
jgi:rare lipoprotein A